jgi:hypothetical protein
MSLVLRALPAFLKSSAYEVAMKERGDDYDKKISPNKSLASPTANKNSAYTGLSEGKWIALFLAVIEVSRFILASVFIS